MKLSEHWLHTWVNPTLTREELSAKLTMSGLEVESLAPIAEKFSGVVVAQVVTIEKHPKAERLQLCQVNIGKTELLKIVCGAKNIKIGMKVPLALAGAVLPNNVTITQNEIAQVLSEGMLCSAHELNLSDESEGLFVLPDDATLGDDIWEYLQLTDFILDVAITPNRGDCLSVMGIAKEIAALTECQFTQPTFAPIKAVLSDQLTVTIDSPAACPRYVGRIIRHVKADATTPIWLQERLRRSGLRCIYPVVDVMNYVMLELGQPMHAFDLQKVVGNIHVRMAKKSEPLKLLDGQTANLNSETLVIADDESPLAIAGVMGGLDSGVSLLTQDIFLESAFFNPKNIAYTARQFNLGSDSSYRFERGIDPTLQVVAIERATELLLSIVGGEPGPVIDIKHEKYIPLPRTITLRAARVTQILGLVIQEASIETILQRLGFSYEKNPAGWQVTVPARRSDILLEIDLIEEIIRLYGYEQLPLHSSFAAFRIHPRLESELSIASLRQTLCKLGYHEAITYSFIDKKLQALFDPEQSPKELVNPITADMAVMRTTLWPGLINTLLYNQNRQQLRVRLFEVGLRFLQKAPSSLIQQKVISGLLSETAFPEQWGIPSREIDFFDLKGDLQHLFRLTLNSQEFIFQPASHPALHPGQTAEIYRKGQYVGICGALHPTLLQELGIPNKVYLFELLQNELERAKIPHFTEISKFPEIRRDLAILVDQTIPSQQIQDTILKIGGKLLKAVNVFDVYQGKGIAPQQKSIALALTLQHPSRTLVDEEVADLIQRMVVVLKQEFAAELRG